MVTREFFENLLVKIEKICQQKQLSIIAYQRHKDKEVVYALAATLVNPVTQQLEFTPLAFFWNKNPLASMQMLDQGLLASQKSLLDWAKECEQAQVDIKNLN